MKKTPHRSRKGYTLVEVVVTTTIASLLMAGFYLFQVDTMKVAFTGDHKNRINRDVRTVTAELSTYARMANGFRLYRSFADADRDTAGDHLFDGSSGDFLLLIYYGNTTSLNFTVTRPIERLVGYFRLAEDPSDPSSAGPVIRFVYNVPESKQNDGLENLIPSNTLASTAISTLAGDSSAGVSPSDGLAFNRVLELSEGLANNRLFYNLWDSSIMVNGMIIHGNDAKRVTDTYNFTISPRNQVNQM